MALQDKFNSYNEAEYNLESQGRTLHGEWYLFTKLIEGWISNRYVDLFAYYVDGDVTNEVEDDFILAVEGVYTDRDYTGDDLIRFLYSGRCNLGSLKKKINENFDYYMKNSYKIEFIDTEVPTEVKLSRGASNLIFVVHGHDREMRESVARTLEKLDLKPIILEEKPNQGLTIIEKLEKYSDVCFSVILLSPDDIAYNRNDQNDEKLRARQNVIFELGWFMAQLGRGLTAVLFKPHDQFDLPSDISGVLYIQYDRSGSWKLELARELKACGLDIDANKIL